MIKRIFYYTIFLVGFLFVTGARIAQAVSLPDFSSTGDLPGFISSVYGFALTVVGIAVFIRILYAGFLMLTAAGNASKWGDARMKMQNAVIGAIILFSAYLILYVINPDLVRNTFNFNLPPSSQGPGGPPASQGTPPTSGPAQVRGTIPANSAFLDKLISGARAAGIYSFDLRVVDADGNDCVQTYAVETVAQAGIGPERTTTAVKKSNFLGMSAAEAADECSGVSLATVIIPQAIEGREYYIEIPAYGGRMPYIYSIIDGELPPGLSLVADTEKPNFIGPSSSSQIPVAVLTANGQQNLTVHSGDSITYRWSSSGANAWESWYTADAPDCPGGVGLAGEYKPWVASTENGTSTEVIKPCQVGRTYAITYQANNSSAGTGKAVTITIVVLPGGQATVGPTPTPTRTQTPRPQQSGFCATRTSTCPGSGYTWMEGVYGCLSNMNQGEICSTDNQCVSLGLGPSAQCWARSNGTCGCISSPGANFIGPCCFDYNSRGLATAETAETLGECLGMKVETSRISSWVFIHPSDARVYELRAPNGSRLSAGLVANTYMRNTKAYADGLIADEACR